MTAATGPGSRRWRYTSAVDAARQLSRREDQPAYELVPTPREPGLPPGAPDVPGPRHGNADTSRERSRRRSLQRQDS